MAERQSTAEDLKSGSDLFADFYNGTQEELVAAGVCKRNWFPEALIPEFCKDGRPKIGNNGRQRYKRTYCVENSSPAVELWHRRDSFGHEFWIVRIEVTKQEAARRQTDSNREAETQAREDEKRCREREEQTARAKEAARPVVSQLRKRYPDLILIEGEIHTCDDGNRVQSLTFYARSLEALRRHDLLTEEILSVPLENNNSFGEIKGGGSFFFFSGSDARGAYWYITLRTQETLRERKCFPVTEARGLLKSIAARA